MQRSLLSVLAFVALAAGCYHATIETGRPESGQMITQSFASAWVYGLVPPKTVSTAAQCPNGVARVETRLSFVNQLVGLLTLGIYTPMEIKVACASGSAAHLPDIRVPSRAGPDDVVRVMAEAADRTVSLGRPVIVQF